MSESNQINNNKEIILFMENIILKIENNNEILKTKIMENNQMLQDLKSQVNILKTQYNQFEVNETIKIINSPKNKNNDEIISGKNTCNNDRNKRKNDKFKNIIISDKIKNFHFLKINQEFDLEMLILFENFILNTKITLNDLGGFDRKEINEENKQIKNKIFKQLNKISNKEKNYIIKKVIFLEKIGKIVRFSHEMGIYIFQILLEIFKEKIGFHSLFEEKVRLYFSTWVKKQLNENCFNKLIKNEKIINQIDMLITFEDNEQRNFIYDLFSNLVKLYFHCYLTDIIVHIIYANKDELFDWDIMEENIINMVDHKKVLFTFLPGLCCNNQFFDNSQIYVVAYPTDNPKKFDFQKTEFEKIDADIQIPLNNLKDKIDKIEVNYQKTPKKGEKNVLVEFEVNLGIEIPTWDSIKYKFILIDCQNYEINGTKTEVLTEECYGRCICQLFVNNILIKESEPIILDLRVKK